MRLGRNAASLRLCPRRLFLDRALEDEDAGRIVDADEFRAEVRAET